MPKNRSELERNMHRDRTKAIVGIYCIENRVGGKKYIGQSSNITKRFSTHKNALCGNRHKNRHLQFAWNKYGEELFSFYVLLECESSELDSQEVSMINFYQTNKMEFGYNLTSGGNLFSKHAQETIEKIRAWNIGRKLTDETKKKLSEINKGKTPKMSKEGRMSQALFMKGKKYRLGKGGNKMSDESKKKMSESHKGEKNPQWGKKRTKEQIEKMMATRRSRTYSSTSRKSMKYKHSQDFLDKHSKVQNS